MDSQQSLTTPPQGGERGARPAGGIPQHYDVIQKHSTAVALLEEEISVLLAENERWVVLRLQG